MTMALSSRLTCVRARWRAPPGIALTVCRRSGRIRMRPPRRQTVGRPQSRKWGEIRAAQWQRWPDGPSRGRVLTGENVMCHLLSLSANYDGTSLKTSAKKPGVGISAARGCISQNHLHSALSTLEQRPEPSAMYLTSPSQLKRARSLKVTSRRRTRYWQSMPQKGSCVRCVGVWRGARGRDSHKHRRRIRGTQKRA